MTWFTASLFFRSAHSSPSKDEPLWEETIRLIDATCEEDALEKAKALGKSLELSYRVSASDSVAWQFVCVERVNALDANVFKAGEELFSRFLRNSEAESLLTAFKE